VFVSPLVVYFCIGATRGAAVLCSVLGAAFAGIITSDDHSAYVTVHQIERINKAEMAWASL